jgi:putative pyruvate formate lyase activating enzyme
VVAAYGPHFGEGPPLVGYHGSGTIFFGGCSLKCVFCRNSDISQGGEDCEISIEDLADTMLSLERQGCHNVNLVTPAHQLPQILAAVEVAAEAGLDVPIVYNCGGYEPVEALKILDGVVDIYLPDAKCGDNCVGETLSGVPDYWDRNRDALREMHSQVGDLEADERGVALHGLIVRHLVLPGNLAGTREVMRFIAEEISVNTYVNIMDQYHPTHRSRDIEQIDRGITRAEYDEAVHIAIEEGLWRFAE